MCQYLSGEEVPALELECRSCLKPCYLMITLQQKSVWSSDSWLKRQAVTAWSECTFISKITIGYLQVSWNNSSEKRGRQHGSKRGQGALCHSPSHAARAEFCFADLFCIWFPPPCWKGWAEAGGKPRISKLAFIKADGQLWWVRSCN